MSKNFIQRGDVITIKAVEQVKSGDGVKLNDLFGIATIDANPGDDLPLALVGVFALPKANIPIQTGEKIYWDSKNLQTTTTKTDNLYIGKAITQASNTDETINTRLVDSG